jgi:hypothetical protein
MILYEQSQRQMASDPDRVLTSCRTFEARLRSIIGHKFEYSAPDCASVGSPSAIYWEA